MQHVVNANLLLPSELAILEEIQSPDRTYWIPLVWCTALIRRAKMDGRIPVRFVCRSRAALFADYCLGNKSLCNRGELIEF